MTLYEQLYSILYHFIMGQVFAFVFSFVSIWTINFKSINKMIHYGIFSCLFTLIYYYGLFHINGGITNIYLGLLFFSGLLLYYNYCYCLILPLFLWIKRLFLPLVKKMSLAKLKIYGIMAKLRERTRRLRRKNEQRKNTKSEKNENV